MKLSLKSFGKRIKDNTIKSLECDIGYQLPDDYRQFLVGTNGGNFENPVYLPIPNGQVTMLDTLNGIDVEQHDDIRSWLVELEDALPQGYLPIASDAGNNQILLKLDGTDRGVYYWDWQSLFEASDDENNTYLVANSFADFVEMMTPSYNVAESKLKELSRNFPQQSNVTAGSENQTSEDWKSACDMPLSDRLDCLANNFSSYIRTGKLKNPQSSALFGYMLVAAQDSWTDHDQNFIDLLVTKKIQEEPRIVELAKDHPLILNYYASAFGFVKGLLSMDFIDGKVFFTCKRVVFDAVLRNQKVIDPSI